MKVEEYLGELAPLAEMVDGQLLTVILGTYCMSEALYELVLR